MNQKFRSIIGLGFILLSFCLFSCKDEPSSKPDKPNILLILIDDLGYSAITPYGNPYQEMPALEKLREQGMLFTDAYVTPQCTPTRASLLTGQHTARNGMWHVTPGYSFPFARMQEPEYRKNLPIETYTLAEALKDQGYTTACLGKWHLNTWESGIGYYTYLWDSAKHHHGFDYVNPVTDPQNYHQRGDKGVEFLTNEAIKFMEQNQEQPFFIYLSQHTIHGPVLAPDTLVEKYKDRGWPYQYQNIRKINYPTNATYLAALEHINNSISRLMQSLEDMNLKENTLVIFLSDNGGVDNEFENYPLRYGKGSNYEGGIRVPFIASWPGTIPANSTEHTPVHVTDFYPTLLDLAGGKMPENHAIDGVSLKSLLLQKDTLDRNTLYCYPPLYDIQWGATPSAIIREGDYKLIHFFGDHIDLEDSSRYITEPKTVLYNLADDMSETQDLSQEMPELTRRLEINLLHWIDSMGAELPTLNPKYNPDSAFYRPR